ncbi:hypothetical protein JCGZ_19968 [Jatropha curcas]|uniref:Protein kinase domain-containing protein n=1 Tax=Jatropha curcas TaxID=180498 RepID=A0A067K650_JATCU|nr:hypothetical protein JCGZ_19968 [Jatropha curcas]
MNPMPEGICSRFTTEEIRNATNNFDRDLLIGDGGFGTAFEGSKEFWTKIEMLLKLRHPHLLSLIGYCNDQRLMVLVYEYVAHGNLRDHLDRGHNSPLPWKQRLEICIGAARGIKYLHAGAEHSIIIHRDIKSTNISLDEKWVPKVSDFGLSRLGPTSLSMSHVTTDVKGAFGYLDPYYFTNNLSVKSDVFSFGVLLFGVIME